MPNNSQTEGKTYASLVSVEGHELPEPASEEHRMLLWTIAGLLGKSVKEAAVVGYVTERRFERQEPVPISRRDELIVTKFALNDLKSDGLVVNTPNNFGTITFQSSQVAQASRRVHASRKGMLIAAESARRTLERPVHSSTKVMADRVYRSVFAYLWHNPKV